MDVRDVMLTNVPVVTPSASLPEVAEILARNGGNAVLVVDGLGEVVGLISESVLAGIVNRISEAQDQRDARSDRPRIPALV